ncbi:YD repeat protein [Coleofasciculus chthonoplastes PCC 7420]|uniref:YD repeat protein n=1 Tax=Coleofasciculus chthonoplastes PCC 7420 TaxID=118168 RepID=B4VHC8_9CYAN|nr:AAA-like domain-containing protein [Coleofasciculus chthonoplastes]EDX78368.1 YD repeat protein [Coleofasciculus chthonoplastes PCC 7420]
MSVLTRTENYYKIGGSLKYQHPTYVKRQADDELYDGLKQGEYCYVLNSRQMGKSSLRVRMMKILKSEGIKCASIDMTRLGSQTTPEAWYLGIVSELVRNFGLSTRFDDIAWWKQHEILSPLQRLNWFIEDVLLTQFDQNLVVFLDEIDSIIKLNFKDDFFAFIRACYNQRADNPDYNRLTFCLLGVATPSNLIDDKKRTPFNIGRSIQLGGFQFEDAKASLIPGFVDKVDDPETVLKEVLNWTGGQPFLTQKLCYLIGKYSQSRTPDIAQIVHTYILENWQSQDEPEHLRTIRDRLLSNEQRAERLLGLYQHLLQQGQVAVNDHPEQMELRLSGLVVKQQQTLRVYNRIYQTVFNLQWVNEKLANLRPYSEAITAWFASKGQDNSRLLRGQALQEARQWAANQCLSDQDYQFLAKSEQWEKWEVERALDAEKKERKLVLLEMQIAQEKIKQAQEQARREKCQNRLKFAVTWALVLAVATGTGFYVRQQLKQTYTESLEEQIKKAGDSALLKFELGQLEALLQAMKAGHTLATSFGERPLVNYPTTRPVLALQEILNNIQERNQLHHQGSVESLAFSRDGQTIVTASLDGMILMWNRQGKPIGQLPGHPARVTSIAISQDGQRIASASIDGTVRLWHRQENGMQELPKQQGWVRSVAFSPDGELIATASSDHTARLWDIQGNLLQEFTGHEDEVTRVAFSPDGQFIATASSDHTARLWDIQGNLLQEFKGHQGWVRSVAFSPDGKFIATASSDHTARLWDIQGNLLQEFKGHQGRVTQVMFSPDGQFLGTASMDGTARLWDWQGNVVQNLKGHQGLVTDLAMSRDGQIIVTATSDGIAHLWTRSHNQPLQGHQDGVTHVTFSPDGQLLGTASSDGTARLWNRQGKSILEFKGHQGSVTDITFRPDQQMIATASSDGTVRLWDIQGKLQRRLPNHSGGVAQVAFSPDGQLIATASSDGIARLWDIQGNLLQDLIGHQGWVRSLAFSPDGTQIATASSDRTVRLWDLQGNLRQELKGHQGWVKSVAFSPNGDYIATASIDGIVRLWDTDGNLVKELNQHPSGITHIAFSPDGTRIATASFEGIARLWDLQGNLVQEIKGHQGAVVSVTFSPDGTQIATASSDGTARIWQVEGLGELLSRGCIWLQDYLVTHPEAREELQVCDFRE